MKLDVLRHLLFILLLLAALDAAWMLRWDVQPAGLLGNSIPTAYVLDRWTGTVYFATHQDMNRLKR
ncbi:MAG: hypothetical protein FJY55_07605 [Betaproteobacteria bacterium]|nr:hypothetical protein [Betaproteobacteria bacterium]